MCLLTGYYSDQRNTFYYISQTINPPLLTMRQLSTKLTLALGMLLPLFYGCGNDDDDGIDLVPPSIEATAGDPASVEVGATTTITYTVTAPGGFATATASTNDDAIATASVTTNGTVGQETNAVVVTVTGVGAGTTNVTLSVEDQQDQQATDDVEVTVTAPGEPEPPTTGDTPLTPGDTIAAIADLSSLNAALDTAGLVETLNGEGPYTIFAPNNAAFTELLGDRDLDQLITDLGGVNALASVLQAHVVEDSLSSVEVTAAAATPEDSLETLNTNAKLGISADADGNLFVNGAAIVQADIFTSNGVIHIIDSVVNTDTPMTDGGEGEEDGIATAGDTLSDIAALSTLAAAVDAEGIELTETLNTADQVTIFAPNNAAFTELLASQNLEDGDLAGLIAALTAEGVKGILQAHVVADSLSSVEVTAQVGGDSLNTLNTSAKLGITQVGQNLFVNGAQIVTPDIFVGNGVIHIIDSVVNTGSDPAPEPPEEGSTVVDVIADNDDLNSLEAAIGATGTELATTLRGDGPFTVFAPDNAAFDAVLNGRTLEQLVSDLGDGDANVGAAVLAEILQAHVIAGQNLASGQLVDSRVYTSVDGATLTVEISGDIITVNGAEITTPDLTAENGVVHIIDEVVNTDAANTGANGFTVTIENISSNKRFFQHGTFGDGPAAGNGGTHAFSFNAGNVITANGPSPRLSFITMLAASSDLILATGENGLELYPGGTAIVAAGQSLDITDQLTIWDAGTKNDNDEDEDVPVTSYGGDAFSTAQFVVTLARDNTDRSSYTVTITNNSATTENTTATPLSPGVFGVHTENTPIFQSSNTTSSIRLAGLEELAEDGDPAPLEATMNTLDGFAVPISPGVFAVYEGQGGEQYFILQEGQPAGNQGLERLAEDGVASDLGDALAPQVVAGPTFAAGDLTASGVFDAPLDASGQPVGGNPRAIAPGEQFQFTLTGEQVTENSFLSFATMMVQSNDIVYSTPDEGVALFDANGNPLNGDISTRMIAYDVGTEVDEYPGAGFYQPIRQGNTVDPRPAEGGTVTVVPDDDRTASDGFIYRPVEQRIRVTVTPN